LGDHDIRVDLHRPAGLVEVGDLHDQPCPRRVDPGGERGADGRRSGSCGQEAGRGEAEGGRGVGHGRPAVAGDQDRPTDHGRRVHQVHPRPDGDRRLRSALGLVLGGTEGRDEDGQAGLHEVACTEHGGEGLGASRVRVLAHQPEGGPREHEQGEPDGPTDPVDQAAGWSRSSPRRHEDVPSWRAR